MASGDIATGAMLLATLAVVVGSSIVAVQSVRRNRMMATQTLQDFAFLGGNVYAFRAYAVFAHFAKDMQVRIQRGAPTSIDRANQVFRVAMDSVRRCRCGLPGSPVSFAYGRWGDSGSVKLTLVERQAESERQDREAALRAFALAPIKSGLPAFLITGRHASNRWFMIAFPARSANGAQLGFVAFEPNIDSIRTEVFAELFESRPELLSPSLTHQQSNGAIGHLSVTTAAGAELFASDAKYATPYVGRVPFEGDSALMVTFQLSDQAASAMIRGALPTTQLPFELVVPGIALLLMLSVTLALYRARTLAQLRSQFAASVTHELRTPLTQILLNAETLEFGRTRSEDHRQSVGGAIVREARRLVYLIENVLHFSRAERRLLHANPRVTRLDLAVSEHVDELQGLADAAGITLEVDAPDPVNAVIDPEGLRLSLTNLVDNALHYAPNCPIRVTVRANGDRGEVVVDDEGPGIAEKDRRRVLKPFERLGGATLRHPTGSGIGLAVVTEVTRASGGAVTLETSPSGGLRVRLSFPAS